MSTRNLTREDWLKARKKGLGGSDSAAVLGMNPYSSSLKVYLDKVREETEEIDNNYMRLGRDLEDYVAKRFEEETGKKTRRKNAILVHDDFSFIIADIDREVVGENSILECKVSVRGKSSDWEDRLPPHYEIQCLHYLGVTGAEKCYLAALFLSSGEFKVFEINRDDEAIKILFENLRDFWYQNVMLGNEPDPDGSEDADKILLEKFKNVNEEIVELPKTFENSLKVLEDLKEQKAVVEKNIRIVEQDIKKAMGNSQTAFVGERKITWRQYESSRIDSKKLKEEKPDIYEAYCKTTLARRFNI